MLRIVCTADIRPILQAAGWNAARIARVLKHGMIDFRRGANRTFDVLVDRDANDLPAAAVTFLRNRAEVVYVAEWDMAGEYTVLKGADPGLHKFAGWPV